MRQPFYFGIRHLSPAGAFQLRKVLDERRPRLVLVEGPSDFDDLLEDITRPETRPPIAVLAYTKETPVRTILYPFAEYSPEYQAVLWCRENGRECRFMDLPSDVFLAMPDGAGDSEKGEEDRMDVYLALDILAGEDGHETFWERTLEQAGTPEAYRRGANTFGRSLRELTQGRENDWAETVVREAYMRRRIREAVDGGIDPEEIVVVTGSYHVEGLKTWYLPVDDREKDMRSADKRENVPTAAAGEREPLACRAEAEGTEPSGETPPEGIAGIGPEDQGVREPSGQTPPEGIAGTGPEDQGVREPSGETPPAGIAGTGPGTAEECILSDEAMTEAEFAALPRVQASHTLMPYSYYRLSTRSGYGAGNRAPAYYGLLWEAMRSGELKNASYSYLSRIALWQRTGGTPVSPAEVIEAVRLADSLARLRGGGLPALRDLRDAAVTCLGGGSFASISLAVADTEIGAAIGCLPEGVSRTSIQEDFYRCLKNLKLERFRDLSAQELALDLRENRNAGTGKTAWLDLNRSFFLHQLRVAGVGFAVNQAANQENATWAERWIVRWTPEAEMELVEAALKGDTVAQAASIAMKDRVAAAGGMGEIAAVIEDAFTCGMSAAVGYATAGLQAMAVDAASLEDLAVTAHRLSTVIQYGSIRRLDPEPLSPILRQLFYRACLLLPGACICDDAGSRAVVTAMEQLNGMELAHDFLDRSVWLDALSETADRDDLNTKLSGFAAAVLLERGEMDAGCLEREVGRRLSRGVPADLGAGWFEGLAMRNRYALIARLSLWESLDGYLDTLDEEEFKRALVFLRRAFADFTSTEKDEIAENLGEIWGINGQLVSEAVNASLDKEAQELVESLDEFDFDL